MIRQGAKGMPKVESGGGMAWLLLRNPRRAAILLTPDLGLLEENSAGSCAINHSSGFLLL